VFAGGMGRRCGYERVLQKNSGWEEMKMER
jgi:hypothetical protein